MNNSKGNWNQTRVESYIYDGIEENLTLDYKAAASLGKTAGKKKEITKDVSAMANSAGGIIIYGISEYQDPARKHLPEKIDPIDREYISKEWLEQVTSNIQPRIEGLVIYPVSIDTNSNHVVYIVEIPQSRTAHQANDCRYYRRYNFESVPMNDYEVRDVMGRMQYARVSLEFSIVINTVVHTSILGDFGFNREQEEPQISTSYKLKIQMTNIGKVYAQYVKAFINMPSNLGWSRQEGISELGREPIEIDLEQVCTYERDNTVRDLIKGGGRFAEELGPARYEPILPNTSFIAKAITITKEFEHIDWSDCVITWSTHADNAPIQSGETLISNIGIEDLRGR